MGGSDLNAARVVRLRLHPRRVALQRKVAHPERPLQVSREFPERHLPVQVQDEQGERNHTVQPRKSGRLHFPAAGGEQAPAQHEVGGNRETSIMLGSLLDDNIYHDVEISRLVAMRNDCFGSNYFNNK